MSVTKPRLLTAVAGKRDRQRYSQDDRRAPRRSLARGEDPRDGRALGPPLDPDPCARRISRSFDHRGTALHAHRIRRPMIAPDAPAAGPPAPLKPPLRWSARRAAAAASSDIVLMAVTAVLLVDAVVGENGLLALLQARKEFAAVERALAAIAQRQRVAAPDRPPLARGSHHYRSRRPPGPQPHQARRKSLHRPRRRSPPITARREAAAEDVRPATMSVLTGTHPGGLNGTSGDCGMEGRSQGRFGSCEDSAAVPMKGTTPSPRASRTSRARIRRSCSARPMPAASRWRSRTCWPPPASWPTACTPPPTSISARTTRAS